MEKLIEKFIFSLLPLVYLSLLPLPPPPLVLLHTDAGIIWLYAEPMIDRVFYSLRTYPPPPTPPVFPLQAEIGRSISMFPPRHFSHPSRNVDNFVRFREKAEWNFFYLFSRLERTSIVKYLFHDWFSCFSSILYSVLSFFLFGDGLNN